MLPGYNTNGFAHHRLEHALQILADLGYQSVAITVDYHALNPFALDPGEVRRVKQLLERYHLSCVIETGARFLLDPWRKHQPTLLSPDESGRAHRLDFLRCSLRLARELNASALSFWSGSPERVESEAHLWERLIRSCGELALEAEKLAIPLAFEPEPGMLVDTMSQYRKLLESVAHPRFGLTLDVGHLQCLGEVPLADAIRPWRAVLWNVHIEDMRYGEHDHLPFGAGEIDFPPVFRTLHEIGYRGGLHVELSRHSHQAVEIARQSIAFLRGQLTMLAR